MAENTSTNGAATFTEAPVSWNTRYITEGGYDCQLTLRGADLAKVMATAKQALASMTAAGCKPQTSRPPAAANGGGNGEAEGAPPCPTHGKPMKHSQHGGWYCPVKIAEDGGDGKPVYCKCKTKE
jgi:hypothetical protein